MTDEPGYFAAYDDVLAPLLAARGFLDVLARAERLGLLAALREPRTTAEVAALTGLAERPAATVLDVLAVHDVVTRERDRLVLAPAWQALTGPAAFVTLADTLASADVESRLLRAGTDEDYWQLPLADRLTFARAVSPNPYAPGMVAGFRAMAENDPDLARLAAGGRLLELGCGVAGRVLTLLQALPGVHAVGVELAPDLAAEARRRAAELGVSDRFEVVCCDAGSFDRPDAFDMAFWSQFFFPEASRAPALAALLACVRPGGSVTVPTLGDPAAIAREPRGTEARGRSVFRVILDGWGVPDRTPDELVAELGDAGFTEARVVTGPEGLTRVRAVRP